MSEELSPSSSSSVVGKVLVVGNVATGKTSLIRRYVHGFFTPEHKTTIGVDFSLKTISPSSSNNSNLPFDVSLQLWDIAGQERFHGLTRIYYKDAVAAVVVFDLTDRNTFDAALKWKEDIDSKVLLKNGDPIPVLLIGNKFDLVGDEQVQQCCDDALVTSLAKKSGFVGWCKTSAKDNTNIDSAFEAVAKKIADNHVKLEQLGYGQFESGDDLILLRGSSSNNQDQNRPVKNQNSRERSESAESKLLRPKSKSACC